MDGKKTLIRPEDIEIKPNPLGEYKVKNKVFMGQYTEYTVGKDDISLNVTLMGKESVVYNPGDSIDIEILYKAFI